MKVEREMQISPNASRALELLGPPAALELLLLFQHWTKKTAQGDSPCLILAFFLETHQLLGQAFGS